MTKEELTRRIADAIGCSPEDDIVEAVECLVEEADAAFQLGYTAGCVKRDEAWRQALKEAAALEP